MVKLFINHYAPFPLGSGDRLNRSRLENAMPLASMSKRAGLSSLTVKLVKDSKCFPLENDTIWRGCAVLCNRRQRRLLETRPYSQSTMDRCLAVPSGLSSTSSLVASPGHPALSSLRGLPASSLSRAVSYLRPIKMDQYDVQTNVRLLDDVSLHFFQLLFTPEFCFLTDTIQSRGYEMRIVGKFNNFH